MRHVRRAAAVLLGMASVALSAGCVAVNTPPIGRTTGRQPVVFVHGYTAQNLATWITAKPMFQAAGYGGGDLIEFNYNSTLEGAQASARKLGAVVSQAAAKSPTHKVDIMAHSEGNLVSETCMLLEGCQGKVDHWINLAGAQNGTGLAAALPGVPGIGGAAGDMNPISLLVLQLNAKEMQGAIRQQGIKTIVFYSLTDGIIIPGDLCKENFAKNVPFIGTHFTVYTDPSVLAQALQFIKT